MKVYRYGAKLLSNGRERVEEQISLAHRYRNQLVEIERCRRAAVRILREPYDWYRAGRKHGVEIATESQAWRSAFAVKEAIERSRALVRACRKACGVYWGTYLTVEQAAAQSFGDLMPWEDPGFVSWFARGTQRVAVQIQKSKPLVGQDALFGDDTRVRLRHADFPRHSRKDKKPRVVLWLRVGSQGRNPIWACWRLTLHRPLPPDGSVKWVIAVRKRYANEHHWYVDFVVDAPAEEKPEQPKNIVALNLGWRMRPDGMRVAYWVDDAGAHGEMILPEEIFDALDYAKHLEGVRKRLFNERLASISVWLKEHWNELPRWLRQDTRTLSQWRSPGRLGRLVARWKNRRFEGDADIFPTTAACKRDHNDALDCVEHLECWRTKDLHLWRWHIHQRRKALARRDEQYKRWARVFADSYKRVVIDDYDIRGVVGRAALGADASDAEKVVADNISARRHSAAPSRLRGYIENAAGKRAVRHDCRCKTMRCWSCGYIEPWQQDHLVPPIDHRCGECGITWDQDYNHAVQHRREWEAEDASGRVVTKPLEALASGKNGNGNGHLSARQQRFRAAKASKRGRRKRDRSQSSAEA